MAQHDLHSVAFPSFDGTQLESLGRCSLTKLKRYQDGEKLFAACAREWNFYVVKSGKVEIVDESGDDPHTLVIHGPGQFTGEVGQLTGSQPTVSAIARGNC